VNIGAANKKQVIIAGALLAILAAVLIYDLAGTGTSSAAPPATSTTVPRGKAGTKQIAQNDTDPTFHRLQLEESRKIKYEPGRNIFEMQAAPMPTPMANVRPTPPPGPPTPTPTPPPPPIPLKFYGFANKPGETKRIFLAEGDPQNSVVFIAKQGDIVDRRYRVLQIAANSVQIEDVLYNNKQTIPLTAR
jgi:hypothetical protein